MSPKANHMDLSLSLADGEPDVQLTSSFYFGTVSAVCYVSLR